MRQEELIRNEGDGKGETLMTAEDGGRVNVNNDNDAIYWSSRFDCTREQLRAAVEKVGDSITAVERELLTER